MTAKHRKGKSNHKHEDNFLKSDAGESEPRGGGGSGGSGSTLAALLLLLAAVVVGGAAGGWFFLQQQQTLGQLTDSLLALQVKLVKLQSAHEDLRQSSDKHIAESLETRLKALEESNTLSQKQIGAASATAEQLKTLDLPAQLLSLHNEMESRLAEVRQSAASAERLVQLQAALTGRSQELEGVGLQVEGLAAMSEELSRRVEGLTGHLEEMESNGEERLGHLAAGLDGQAAELVGLKQQLDNSQAKAEAVALEMVTIRELLEREENQQLRQAGVEEQLNAVRQSLQDQDAAARNVHSTLMAQLEDIQGQVTKLAGKARPLADSAEETEEAVEEEATEDEGRAEATEDEGRTAESAPTEETEEEDQADSAAPTEEEPNPKAEEQKLDEEEAPEVEEADEEALQEAPGGGSEPQESLFDEVLEGLQFQDDEEPPEWEDEEASYEDFTPLEDE